MEKIIAVVGPTASGKTAIGVKLAKEFGGEIVSADSRQVFRGLDIGTGKEGHLREGREAPTPKSQSLNQSPTRNHQLSNVADLEHSLRYVDGVPQWLIDIKEPEERFSVFEWLPLARLAIEDILSRGKVPIIVGGTGLYIQALTEGFSLDGNISKAMMGKVDKYTREELNLLTIQELINILSTLYPQGYPQVDEHNSHRLVRAIERAQDGIIPVKQGPEYDMLQVAPTLSRQDLYQRIDERVDGRFEEGMLEEVIGLIRNGVDSNWLEKLGLEYRIIGQFVIESGAMNRELQVTQKGESLDSKLMTRDSIVSSIATGLALTEEFAAMKQHLKYKIHAFARRQLTWFRRFPEIEWLSDCSSIKDEVRVFLGS